MCWKSLLKFKWCKIDSSNCQQQSEINGLPELLIDNFMDLSILKVLLIYRLKLYSINIVFRIPVIHNNTVEYTL